MVLRALSPSVCISEAVGWISGVKASEWYENFMVLASEMYNAADKVHTEDMVVGHLCDLTTSPSSRD